MKIGYACINETLKKDGYGFNTMTIKHFNKQELIKRIRNNFRVTYKILEWNVTHNIFMYRMSSNIVPLATHELNDIEWWKDSEVLRYSKLIREIISKYNVQVSFHPDQFCVLNSPSNDVIRNSYDILKYHYKLCKMLNCKILILHVGGAYGDKAKSIDRFKFVFSRLPKQLQDMIYLENDDKSYNVEETLKLCQDIKRPMILDFHHDRCLPSNRELEYYIDSILETWKVTDQEPKCHLSSSRDLVKVVREHSDNVTELDYKSCLDVTGNRFNIMLECKNKEKSVLNLIHKN